MNFPNLTIIGDRIDPGFKATRTPVEEEYIQGLQDLAKRRVDAMRRLRQLWAIRA